MTKLKEPTDTHILAFIGPSAVGKSTLALLLEEKRFISLNPTWTTRPMRRGETTGKEHFFVTEAEFDEAERKNTFHEVVRLFDLPFRYGQPRIAQDTDSTIPSMMLRVMVLDNLRKYYSNVTIYQIEGEKQDVTKRLQQRSKGGESIGSRLKDYELEVGAGRKLADRVFVSKRLPVLLNEVSKALEQDFPEYRLPEL